MHSPKSCLVNDTVDLGEAELLLMAQGGLC